METLITGATGYIGRYLCENMTNVRAMTHKDCNLEDWESVWRFRWEGDTIVHCAHSGKYGDSTVDDMGKNINMMVNMRLRWPGVKIVAFSSGAIYDKSKPIIQAKESDMATPLD
jgi:dTDP-4-dehydrorhamnose reductase